MDLTPTLVIGINNVCNIVSMVRRRNGSTLLTKVETYMGPFVTLNLLWILKVNQIINSVVFLCKIITELGAVAQLGERVVRNDEVGGSNPPSSTNSVHGFRRKKWFKSPTIPR